LKIATRLKEKIDIMDILYSTKVIATGGRHRQIRGEDGRLDFQKKATVEAVREAINELLAILIGREAEGDVTSGEVVALKAK
jgi:hypothetical protein